jgi:hypothetical protein
MTRRTLFKNAMAAGNLEAAEALLAAIVERHDKSIHRAVVQSVFTDLPAAVEEWAREAMRVLAVVVAAHEPHVRVATIRAALKKHNNNVQLAAREICHVTWPPL